MGQMSSFNQLGHQQLISL